ncbi:MAG: MMPL family transporter, partial [Sandaracinaceae bacterium]
TSACAFAALALTEYDAFAQLGAIASIGLLLVLLAILLLCPALLTLAERSGGRWLRIEGDDAPSAALARLTDAVHDRPWLALGLAAIATIALALVARPIAFDADVEALMPREAESARVSRRLRADPSWSNESLAALAEDRDAVARLDAELRALPSVGRVESAALLLEDAELDTKLAILRDARERPDAPAGAPPGPIADELAGLASAAHEVAHDLSATAPSAAAPLRELAEAASRARADLSEADPRRVTAFEHALGERLAHLSLVLRETPRPLSIRDLPGQLRSRLVDGEGRYWVYAYPARDLFAPGELERFDDEVRSVAPDAVGYPLQLEAFLERTKQSAFHASGVALAVVLVLLWLDFRRVTDALLAILPVAVAVGWLYAILGALGVAANLANLAAVPIILGIGVDDGVHLVHRTRELGDPRAAQRSVGGALVLTTLTTIAGFGTIGLAAHRGMQGFALVMSLGSALALLATLVVLPAILALIHRRRSSV